MDIRGLDKIVEVLLSRVEENRRTGIPESILSSRVT
jgi:hypothetical protein